MKIVLASAVSADDHPPTSPYLFPHLLIGLSPDEYVGKYSFEEIFYKRILSEKYYYGIDFPLPGAVSERFIKIPFDESTCSVWAKFDSEIYSGLHGFVVGPLGDKDSIFLFANGPREFVGNVKHTRTVHTEKKRCVVRCADGTSSQDCVTCEHQNVTIKICC